MHGMWTVRKGKIHETREVRTRRNTGSLKLKKARHALYEFRWSSDQRVSLLNMCIATESIIPNKCYAKVSLFLQS